MTHNDVALVATELLPELAGLMEAERIARRQIKSMAGEHKLKWVMVLNVILDNIVTQELVIRKIMGTANLVVRGRKHR